MPARDSAPADTERVLDLERAERLFTREWGFIKSVPALEFLPEADRPEIAFAGRSNVGKSSLINALVRQKGLARASNTPGRTQELNFFEPLTTGATGTFTSACSASFNSCRPTTSVRSSLVCPLVCPTFAVSS